MWITLPLEMELSLVDNTGYHHLHHHGSGGQTSTRFYIPRGHGETYDLKISTVYADGKKSRAHRIPRQAA